MSDTRKARTLDKQRQRYRELGGAVDEVYELFKDLPAIENRSFEIGEYKLTFIMRNPESKQFEIVIKHRKIHGNHTIEAQGDGYGINWYPDSKHPWFDDNKPIPLSESGIPIAKVVSQYTAMLKEVATQAKGEQPEGRVERTRKSISDMPREDQMA